MDLSRVNLNALDTRKHFNACATIFKNIHLNIRGLSKLLSSMKVMTCPTSNTNTQQLYLVGLKYTANKSCTIDSTFMEIDKFVQLTGLLKQQCRCFKVYSLIGTMARINYHHLECVKTRPNFQDQI